MRNNFLSTNINHTLSSALPLTLSYSSFKPNKMNQLHPVSENEGDRNAIQHAGVVSRITDGEAVVSLLDNINCEGCKAKGACGVSESNDKEIVVPIGDSKIKINQTVTLSLAKGLGMKAVFWAYVFPFMLMVTTLMICSFFTSELIAGVTSLAVLIPYYVVLWYLTPVFKKKFQVSLLK